MEDIIRFPSPSTILAPSPPPPAPPPSHPPSTSSASSNPNTPASTSTTSNSLSKAPPVAFRSKPDQPPPSKSSSNSQPAINPVTNKPKQSKSRNGMNGFYFSLWLIYLTTFKAVSRAKLSDSNVTSRSRLVCSVRSEMWNVAVTKRSSNGARSRRKVMHHPKPPAR